MRTNRFTLQALAVVLSCALMATFSPFASAQNYVSSQVLLRFTPGATIACRDSALASVGGTIVDSLELVDCYLVQLADTSVLSAVAELESSYCVYAAQTNGLAAVDSIAVLLPRTTPSTRR